MRRIALDKVHELARSDARVLYVGSDPGAGTLKAMRDEMPERHIIEGISEANLIGMSAGLAMDGFIPYVNTIATFLTRRCYEQIAVDVCLHNLPVRLIANGGGLVYAPLGPTHQAIEDIGIMRVLPGMTVVSVCDADEMGRLMDASLDWQGPIYIRLAKGGDEVVSKAELGFEIGKAIHYREPGRVLFLTTGIMLQRAIAAADMLEAEGISVGILHMPTIKPLDTQAIIDALDGVDLAMTLEEHVRMTGFGAAVSEALIDATAGTLPARIVSLALPDAFIHNYGSQDGLLRRAGLDPEGIVSSVRAALSISNTTAISRAV